VPTAEQSATPHFSRVHDRTYSLLFENARHAVVVVDIDGHVLHSNRAARDLLARVDRPLSSVVLDLLGTARDAQREISARDRDGRAVRLILHSSWIDGETASITIEDITKQRELEAELSQLRRVESLGYVTASVVHDLSNLVTPIEIASTLLVSRIPQNDRLSSLATELNQSAKRASALVGQILSYVRRGEAPLSCVSVSDVVEGIRGILERVLGPHIELALSLDGGAHAEVDRDQLEHLMLNLVANARDAMPNGGRVTIATHDVDLGDQEATEHGCAGAGSYVRLSVTDTGAGMGPEIAEQIFEPFFTTKGARGNGLGLASAYAFVRGAGGSIAVRTAVGEGTTFDVYLPQAQSSAPPRSGSNERLGGGETILVVEDDQAVRDAVQIVLELLGYRVLACGSSSKAMELCARATIDLALVCVDANGASGDVIRRAREAAPRARTLLMSGQGESLISAVGGTNVLCKPFTPSQLAHRVRAVLDTNEELGLRLAR
jgi:two-component system cell cycle sensor histidine kinase/response regulator CckA